MSGFRFLHNFIREDTKVFLSIRSEKRRHTSRVLVRNQCASHAETFKASKGVRLKRSCVKKERRRHDLCRADFIFLSLQSLNSRIWASQSMNEGSMLLRHCICLVFFQVTRDEIMFLMTARKLETTTAVSTVTILRVNTTPPYTVRLIHLTSSTSWRCCTVGLSIPGNL